ncbi:FecR family protein [Pseudoflavitalea rhizosphaerae]|uniref:FecR family protein n=1 Tax=Pseudoflavitalea rhizosphaerae TaxID=1884793 RepID=UPI000F8F58C0|nr:FecR family protein [Pseudoflavitalea rhizosphaerae]
MKITHTLIQKFFENQCTATEAEAVARHLKQHPELMAMYLKSSWDAAGKENATPPGYKEEMRGVINSQIEKQTQVVRFRWISIAASLLVVTISVWLLLPDKKPAPALTNTEQEPAANSGWTIHTNNTKESRKLELGDGTVVKLAPNAKIRYQEPFGVLTQRNIHMEGVVDFDVATNKGNPFTVHTRLFSTTVLGTSFRVSESAKSCNVKLFQGKVLIKSLKDSLKGWKKDLILLPGNEMNYNLEKGTMSVHRFLVEPRPRPRPAGNDHHPAENDGAMIFDNTPLPVVMKTLMSKYNCPITYEEELLKGKFFSGEVIKGDSLSVLLNLIANMNGLQISKKDDGYIIAKSK